MEHTPCPDTRHEDFSSCRMSILDHIALLNDINDGVSVALGPLEERLVLLEKLESQPQEIRDLGARWVSGPQLGMDGSAVWPLILVKYYMDLLKDLGGDWKGLCPQKGSTDTKRTPSKNPNDGSQPPWRDKHGLVKLMWSARVFRPLEELVASKVVCILQGSSRAQRHTDTGSRGHLKHRTPRTQDAHGHGDEAFGPIHHHQESSSEEDYYLGNDWTGDSSTDDSEDTDSEEEYALDSDVIEGDPDEEPSQVNVKDSSEAPEFISATPTDDGDDDDGDYDDIIDAAAADDDDNMNDADDGDAANDDNDDVIGTDDDDADDSSQCDNVNDGNDSDDVPTTSEEDTYSNTSGVCCLDSPQYHVSSLDHVMEHVQDMAALPALSHSLGGQSAPTLPLTTLQSLKVFWTATLRWLRIPTAREAPTESSTGRHHPFFAYVLKHTSCLSTHLLLPNTKLPLSSSSILLSSMLLEMVRRTMQAILRCTEGELLVAQEHIRILGELEARERPKQDALQAIWSQYKDVPLKAEALMHRCQQAVHSQWNRLRTSKCEDTALNFCERWQVYTLDADLQHW